MIADPIMQLADAANKLTVFTQDAVFPVGTQAEEATPRVTDAATTRLARVVLAD